MISRHLKPTAAVAACAGMLAVAGSAAGVASAAAPARSERVIPHQVTGRSASVTAHPASVTAHPASVTAHPASVTAHPASVTAHPASTAGFLLHAGLAFYVFDHYIWQPYKAGDLTHGFTHKLKLVEAVTAAVFVYHEMTLAISDVKSSKLAFLAVPITALASKLSSLKSELGGGNTSAITGVNSSLGSIGQQAAGKGFSVTPKPTGL